MNRIQDMAAIVPYMTCVGNHGKLNQTNIAYCITLSLSLWSPASLQFPSRLVPSIESCQASTRHTEEGMLAAYYLRTVFLSVFASWIFLPAYSLPHC